MGIQSLQLSKAPAKNKILNSGLLFQIVRYCLIFIWLMRATLSINTGLYKGKPESRHISGQLASEAKGHLSYEFQNSLWGTLDAAVLCAPLDK